MSTATIEATPLEGIDLEGSPPCDCTLSSGEICGKPAVYRLVSCCDGCRKTVHGWACRPCWEYLRPYLLHQDFLCRWCLSPRIVMRKT